MKVIYADKLIEEIKKMDLEYMQQADILKSLEDVINRQKTVLDRDTEKEVVLKAVNKGIGVSREYHIESNMHCPCCNAVVGDSEWDALWEDYCSKCGQKLKYTKNEED